MPSKSGAGRRAARWSRRGRAAGGSTTRCCRRCPHNGGACQQQPGDGVCDGRWPDPGRCHPGQGPQTGRRQQSRRMRRTLKEQLVINKCSGRWKGVGNDGSDGHDGPAPSTRHCQQRCHLCAHAHRSRGNRRDQRGGYPPPAPLAPGHRPPCEGGAAGPPRTQRDRLPHRQRRPPPTMRE